MSNYSSRILGTAVSSMTAHQALLGNVSSNLANVNTPGYARRIIGLEASPERSVGNFAVGNGVQIGELKRSTSAYLDRLVQEVRGELAANTITDEFRERIEALFPLDQSEHSIGNSLDSFFTSLNDLSVNPESLEVRSGVISQAEKLVASIKDTYNALADLQSEANQRITSELDAVNDILGKIANLNGEIRGREAAGTAAVGERDQKDQLLQGLSEKLSFNLVDLKDGTVNITLPGGFTLVSGTHSKNLDFEQSPSFVSGTVPPGLNGANLGYVVFDFSGGNGTGHIDLTDRIKAGTGTIGGLLRLRGSFSSGDTSAFQADGILVNIAQRVEGLTRALLTDFNTTYLGPDRDSGTAGWQSSAGDLNGNSPAVFGFFTFNYTGTLDANADGLPTVADLTATGLDNFSSLLKLSINDPQDIAAARDAGSGPPAAPEFPAGDSRNIVVLAASQFQKFTFSAGGSYSFTGTLSHNYNETVATVGNFANSTKVNVAVSQSKLFTAEQKRDAVSAVSLDEEFTKTIKYQRNFEASSKMLKMANDLMEQVLQIL